MRPNWPAISDFGKVAAVVIVVSFAGCATQQSAQKTAALTADIANGLKREMMTFLEEADDLEAANDARLQRLKQQTLALRVDAGNAILAWEVGKDERAIAMYAALAKTTAAGVGTHSLALTLLQPSPASPKTNFDSKQFDSLVKRLNDLASGGSFADIITALFEYGKQVSDNLNKDMKKSQEGLPKTKTAAEEKAKALPKPE